MRTIFKLLIIISLASCVNNTQNVFTINGDTDRVGDAILLKITPSGNEIDTASIKKGKFSFKKDVAEEELFRLKFHDGSSFDLLVNRGEKISVEFKDQDLSISGSPGSQKLIDLDQNLFKLLTYRDSITKELQGLSQDDNYEKTMLEYRDLFLKRLGAHRDYLKDFIEENQQSKVCLMALFQTYGPSSPILSVDEDLEDFEKVLRNLKLNFPKSEHIELLELQIKQFKPLAYGQIAPDFTLPNTNNKQVALSDFKGKVVLVDFWASWCKPCRLENPKLVKLYEKYKDSDFEILSVSLDGTPRQQEPEKAWKDAIEQDQLTAWTHVGELKGWGTYVRELYNLNSIPYTVLIDKKGKIIAKNLKGYDLEIKIKELLNNE